MLESVSPIFGVSQRTPPANIQAEQALLGAILANNKAYDLVADFLQPEHFADAIHGLIFQAIQEHIEGGRLVDAVILRTYFENRGELAEVGGTEYIVSLLSAMVAIINTKDYGAVVHLTWKLREIIDVCEQTREEAFNCATDLGAADALIDALDAKITRIGGSDTAGSVVTLSSAIDGAVAEGEQVRSGNRSQAVSTGFPSIDAATLGLRAGTFTILAARPGQGKTTAAKDIALNVALGRTHYPGGEIVEDDKAIRTVLYFCFEATQIDFGAVCISSLAEVSVNSVLNGDYSIAGADRIVRSRRAVANAPLKSFHKKMSLSQIRRTVRREVRKAKIPVGLVIVDYIQLMPDHRGVDKRLSVGMNANGLKDLAMEMDIPVLALSQLSRKVEERSDKRPQLADLKETSELEEAADVAAFLYRDAYYYEQTRPVYDSNSSAAANAEVLAEWQSRLDLIKYDAELTVAKHRRAKAPALVKLRFRGEFSRFEERTQ